MPVSHTRKMSDRHEEDLVETLGGKRTRNSCAVWSDKSDGHQLLLDQHYRFAWDGKSTLGQSIGVSRGMWGKLLEQCRGLTPLLPLRFYRDSRLTSVDLDLVALELDTFAEILSDANTLHAIREQGCLTGLHHRVGTDTCSVCGASAYDEVQE